MYREKYNSKIYIHTFMDIYPYFDIYIKYIYRYTHTNTHTHIYIYIYIYK